ncbi:hypothetical protein ACSTIX_24200, partial [Vibrio parahaemolyticus]
AALLSGCKKEPEMQPCGAIIPATIIYLGPLGVHGCDALIRIEGSNKYYHPVNLDSLHKINGLKIYADYTLTGDSFACSDFVMMYYKS